MSLIKGLKLAVPKEYLKTWQTIRALPIEDLMFNITI